MNVVAWIEFNTLRFNVICGFFDVVFHWNFYCLC